MAKYLKRNEALAKIKKGKGMIIENSLESMSKSIHRTIRLERAICDYNEDQLENGQKKKKIRKEIPQKVLNELKKMRRVMKDYRFKIKEFMEKEET